MKLTGAEILCKSLVKEGVDTIFGYPGGAIIPVYDALLKYPSLKHILVRHEQGAAHAAEGYARATGKPGVCLVTSGPGATNLVTGLADAMMDSVPIICISGQVTSTLLGYDAFQEIDIVGISSMITKHNYLVMKAEEIAQVVKEAFYLATTGRPGPIMIDFTKDAQLEKVEYKKPNNFNLSRVNPIINGNIRQIQKAADIINKSKKPMIIAGHGVIISKAEKELIKLSQKADIPIAATLLGLSSIDKTHPFFVGMVGMHGNLAPNICTNKADVIIGLGLRFDDRVTSKISDYAKKAKIIHIDIDPAELDKNIKSDVPIVGDVRQVLRQLSPLIKRNKHQEWFDEFKKYYQIEHNEVIKKEAFPTTGKIRMGEVIRNLSEETKGEATIVADVGQNQICSALYYQFRKKNSFITSGGLGTMGFSLPASIGVKKARPKEEVWVVVGDGGFQMTIQEMATIAQENLEIKIALLNNNFLGMVRQWQQLFFDKKYSEVYLNNPDFIKLAEGFSIPAEKISKREDIVPAIRKARNHRGAYLLEFEVETEANVFPMIPVGAAVDQVRLK